MSKWIARDGFQEIQGKDCVIILIPRPPYCDRGNWLAQLHPVMPLSREIDDHDGWPRYYFDEEHAKLEIEAWLDKRGQAIS